MKSYFKKEMALLLTLLALTASCGREARRRKKEKSRWPPPSAPWKN